MAFVRINIEALPVVLVDTCDKSGCSCKIKFNATNCKSACESTTVTVYGDTNVFQDITILYKDVNGTLADTGYYCCSPDIGCDNTATVLAYWDSSTQTFTVLQACN